MRELICRCRAAEFSLFVRVARTRVLAVGSELRWASAGGRFEYVQLGPELVEDEGRTSIVGIAAAAAAAGGRAVVRGVGRQVQARWVRQVLEALLRRVS